MVNYAPLTGMKKPPNHTRRWLCAALMLAAAGLSACGNKAREGKPGQALASVNGAEITVLQLNEELQRAAVGPAQQEAASKQLLQVLIDRQLLQTEAAREKLDRDPKVMQAIERAKALIVAQAYLQKRVGNQVRPTAAEVEDYYNKNPQFFAHRQQFNMNELLIATGDLTPELKAAADASKTLEQLAAWMEAHKVKFGRTQVARSTADLTPEMSAKLLSLPKGQLFIVKEGERSLLISIAEIREAPVTLETASQQIEQFLFNKRNKDGATAELDRLRASAKIEYLNKSLAMDAKPAPAATAAPAPSLGATATPASPAAGSPAAGSPAAPPDAAAKAALDRGVAGLK